MNLHLKIACSLWFVALAMELSALADYPIVSHRYAAELAATYALGPNQLLSTNSPPLSLAATPTTLTLTWPLANAGFTVQSRTNLVLGDWMNVASPAPQIIGGQWRVTLPPSTNDSMFYRLMK
ncbi:MAG: hypothetical protein U1F83_14585 [Verrucomicrobiota bacterium]